MRNYTSKTQKIKMFSVKYNKTEDEINEILTKHEDLLTLDELKIKYDNPDIGGKLPDWLTEEELDKIIWKSIHQYWNTILASKATKEDIYMEQQIYLRKKMHLYKNHNHLKSASVNRILSLTSEITRRDKYFIGSTDETYDNETTNNCSYKYEPSVTDDKQKEDELFLDNIRSLKNKSVKELLIVIGYLICNISELHNDYLKIISTKESEIYTKLNKIEKDLNDKSVRKNKFKPTDIIEILKFDQELDMTIKDSLEELKSFMLLSGLL